jgi:hypothetical protein
LVGDALGPVRDQVVIATKFGFDIDAQTRERRGLNRRPDHIRHVTASSSSGSRRVASTCSIEEPGVNTTHEVPRRQMKKRTQGEALAPVHERAIDEALPA